VGQCLANIFMKLVLWAAVFEASVAKNTSLRLREAEQLWFKWPFRNYVLEE
jgi:hypothetical protein